MDLQVEINDTLAKIDELFEQLRSAVNDVLRRVPGWASAVGDAIRKAWDTMCEQATKFWDFVSNIVTHMGDPWALTDLSRSWTSEVGGPVSGQVGVAEAGNLEVDDHWAGDAADNYRQRLSLHKAALASVKASLTDGLSSALDSVRTGIITFWVCLVIALAALVGGIITAIGSTASVVGAPAGPFIAGAAILACVGSITGGEYVLKNLCTSAVLTLEQKVIGESTSYFHDQWPKGALA